MHRESGSVLHLVEQPVVCESKNGYQKDMYLKEIEPSTQNNVNHFRFNRQHSWGELYNHFVRKRMLTFGND